jgi:hypothetical protein
MDATKRLGQRQKSNSSKNLNHEPKHVANYHMGTQLMKLNETIHWILRVKNISKVLKNHARWTTNKWNMHKNVNVKVLSLT